MGTQRREPVVMIVDDHVNMRDTLPSPWELEAVAERLNRELRETRVVLVGRTERGPVCSKMRIEDLVLPEMIPAVIGIPQRMRGFLAGVLRQFDGAVAASDFGLPAWPHTRWLHNAGLRWSPR